jgi:hypothetical protein
MSLGPEALYLHLRALVASMPALADGFFLSAEEEEWIARAHALVALISPMDAVEIRIGTDRLGSVSAGNLPGGGMKIRQAVRRALAIVELAAPPATRGAFILTDSPMDAFSALAKVFAAAKDDLLIIDPYMDEKLLMDFAPLAAEGVTIRLLTDPATVKPGFTPAVHRWIAQHGLTRPLEARSSRPRACTIALC